MKFSTFVQVKGSKYKDLRRIPDPFTCTNVENFTDAPALLAGFEKLSAINDLMQDEDLEAILALARKVLPTLFRLEWPNCHAQKMCPYRCSERADYGWRKPLASLLSSAPLNMCWKGGGRAVPDCTCSSCGVTVTGDVAPPRACACCWICSSAAVRGVMGFFDDRRPGLELTAASPNP